MRSLRTALKELLSLDTHSGVVWDDYTARLDELETLHSYISHLPLLKRPKRGKTPRKKGVSK